MPDRACRPLLAFLALAVFWTWPLALHLSTRIPHDPGDPILNIWLLWWNAHAIPFTDRWWNPPIFIPMRGALALSEHLAGIGLVTTPVQLLHANALAAYNIALILSFALSGLFTFLLVRRLVRSSVAALTRELAAVCGALAYGFGPYRAGQLAHLQVLTAQWMPLALLALHGYIETGNRRWLPLFAAAWLVQALSNGYYLLFFPVLLVLWLAWFVDWRRAPSRGVTVVATWALASLPLVPILMRYASVQRSLGLVRTPEEVTFFSAKAGSFLNAPGMLAVWPSSAALTSEEFLFPGLMTLLLVIGGTVAVSVRHRSTPDPADGADVRSRSALVFYAAAAIVMWALAFGPAEAGSGLRSLLHPYTLLTFLPGFEGLRVPARFAMLATLCISVAAGVGFALAAPSDPRRRSLAAAFAVGGLLVDGWTRPMPLVPPPGRVMIPAARDAVRLDLPADEGSINVAAMYRQTEHGRAIVNGYSGHIPPHYAILSIALRHKDPSVITELARRRPLLISVNQALDADGNMQDLVRGLPGVEPQGGSSGGALFFLPALPASRTAPTGEALPASIRDSGRDAIDLDLGQPKLVRTIGFDLRWRYRELEPRIAIETSLDGQHWLTAWEDWTGGPAMAASLVDPLATPVRLTIPDVTARYVRVHPVPPWMRRELRVYGPK
jgi:hypothetical protein